MKKKFFFNDKDRKEYFQESVEKLTKEALFKLRGGAYQKYEPYWKYEPPYAESTYVRSS
jgi:hypothetical protein